MLSVEACGEAEVCKFDVATAVEEDVVWFYVASRRSVINRINRIIRAPVITRRATMKIRTRGVTVMIVFRRIVPRVIVRMVPRSSGIVEAYVRGVEFWRVTWKLLGNWERCVILSSGGKRKQKG